MSTRGIYGFRMNETDKLTYNHYDSYPDGLGVMVVDFINKTPISEMIEIFNRIQLVNEKIEPTKFQISECYQYFDKNVGVGELTSWYCLLRKSQGQLIQYTLGLNYMIDRHDFILDSLFCEYGYIINLDSNELEFWVGFQESPQIDNRYGVEPIDDGECIWYPCKLVGTWPLENLPTDIIEQMYVTESERGEKIDYD